MQLVLKVFGLILSISVSAMPKPDAFDDEGEMSVPRSPKIDGPAVTNLQYAQLIEAHKLQCHIIEGSPTPTVIWLKDGQEIQGTSDVYNMTYNATDGKAELCFSKAIKKDIPYASGNFTCVAANFLGKSLKTFVIQVDDKNETTMTSLDSLTKLSSVTNKEFTGFSSTLVYPAEATEFTKDFSPTRASIKASSGMNPKNDP